MAPRRLSCRCNITPVPSYGSTFVYMITPRNVIPAWVTPAWVHHGCCTGGDNFTPVWNLTPLSCKRKTTTCFGVESVCQYTGTGSPCVMFVIFIFESHVYFINILKCTYLQITRYEMTQSVRNTKSKSHPGMKLAPVRVFSCKHPLNEKTKQQIWDSDTRQQKEKIETLWEVKITQKQHFKTHQKCFLGFKMLSQNFPETHVCRGTNNSIHPWEQFFNNLVKHIRFMLWIDLSPNKVQPVEKKKCISWHVL